jgi:hypothetical protein
MLKSFIRAMYAECKEGRETEGVADGKPGRRYLVIADLVTVTYAPPDRVLLTWRASPQADMIADSLVAVIGQAEVSQGAIKATSRPCGHSHHHAGHTHDGGAHPHAAPSGEQPTAMEQDGSQSPDPLLEVACLVDVPWAKAILSSDSGPFSQGNAPLDVLEDTGAGPVRAVHARAGGSEELEQTLPVPVRRRRNHLLNVFTDQYGEGAVTYHSGSSTRVEAVEDAAPVAPRPGAGQGALFHIRVQLDGKVGGVECRQEHRADGDETGGALPHSLHAYSSDDALRSAIARVVEVTDSMLQPVTVGQMSTYGR